MIATKQHYALEEVCLRITDGSHFSPKDDVNGVFPMLSVKDMGMTGFVYDTCKYINENDYQTLIANGCKPSINDVLVAKDGSYLKTAFVQKEDKEQVLLSSIAILTPNIEILYPDYLAYFFKSNHTRNVVERHYLTGTAIKRIILKGFRKILIPIPPLPEQEKIVSELDCLSGIIEKKRQQLKELDALAQSIFYEMFGDSVGEKNNWDSCRIGDIYKFQYGKGNKIPENKGEYPCYGSNGQVGFHTDYNSEDSPIIGHIGAYAGIVNWASGKHYVTYNGVICTLRNKEFNPQYGFYLLKSQNYMENARGGAAQPFVSYDMLESPTTYIPPLPLQQTFAQKIEAIEQQKALIKQSIAEVETLFNARMQEYFE